MRYYQNCLEMHKEVERDIHEMGVRYQTQTVQDQIVAHDPGYMTLELMAYSYCLTDMPDLDLFLETKAFDSDVVAWALQEAFERCDLDAANKNPGTAYTLNPKLWEQFLHDGKFSYTYAERLHAQIARVIVELQRTEQTRQAVMTMYESEKDMKNWGALARIPCTMNYQFLIRQGELHCIYNMRSCDFKKFFVADVYLTRKVQELIATAVGVPVGKFIHNIGSLHAFRRDLSDVVF